MYEFFCRLAISLKKTCAFRKNTILQKNNFFIIWVKIQVSYFFACYVSVKSGNTSFNGDLEIKKFNKLIEVYDLASEGW